MNNPLYANISINNDWINDSLANDTELFTSLTQQPNEIVSTEELNEIVNTEEPNEIVNTEELNEIVTTEQPELTMEVCTSDQLDIIANAYNMLSSIAQRNGHNIHNVAADGNCLFAYQLLSIGIYNIDIHALRNNVVSHLENNPYVGDVHYCNFLSAPVSTSNSYNADTEAPTAEDEYISRVMAGSGGSKGGPGRARPTQSMCNQNFLLILFFKTTCYDSGSCVCTD